jgi:hypothetical protein
MFKPTPSTVPTTVPTTMFKPTPSTVPTTVPTTMFKPTPSTVPTTVPTTMFKPTPSTVPTTGFKATPPAIPAVPKSAPATTPASSPLVPTVNTRSNVVSFYTKAQGALIAELPSGIHNKFSRPNDWEKLLGSTYIEVPSDLVLNVTMDIDGHLEENVYLNTVQGGFANQLHIVKFDIQTLPSQPISSDFKMLTSILKPSKCQDVLPSTNINDKLLIFNDVSHTSTTEEPTRYCTEGIITDFSQFKDISKPRSMQIPQGTQVALIYKNNTAKIIDSTQDPENIIFKDMASIQISDMSK